MSRFRVVLAVLFVALLGISYAHAQCAGGAGAQTGLAAVSCTGVAAWNPTGVYATGAQVVYNNCLYQTNQAFTSNSSWCPGCSGVYLYGNGSACPTAGCNYGAQGPCSGATATATATARATATATSTPTPTARGTATSTATPTATSRATATSTSTATATPTPTSGGGSSANYTAQFWTQGNDPCLPGNSGAAGTGDPWFLPTPCGGGGQPACAAAWVSTTAYNGGQTASRSCGGATPTSTPTPTPTARGTATPTSGTPTATPTTGGNCAADWVSTNSYNAGVTVSRVCGSAVRVNYTAAFFANAGDDPCMKNGVNGSGLPWNVPSGCNVTAPTGNGVSGVMSSAQFEAIFPSSTSGGSRNQFYTYNGLVAGGNAIAGFATTGDSLTKAREVAAFLANSSLETARGVYIEEIDKSGPPSAPFYCDGTACNGYTFPCDANHWYYGRGWLQLSWNFNYCPASVFVFGAGRHDYIDNPNLLSTDATQNTSASLWYWMTQHTTTSPQLSAHACITGGNGFGCTIAAINGPLECPGSAAAINRGLYFESIRSILGTTAVGSNGC